MGFGATFVLPQQQVLDTNGDPVPGAKVYFYDAGTSDEQTVYTDSALSVAHTQPVVADAAGRLAPIFIGEGAYKVVITDSADVSVYSEDNLKAAKDGALVGLTFARPQTPVVTLTSSTALAYPTHFGKLIKADTTAGSITLTLPAAATAGDAATIKIVKIAANGTVSIRATGTDQIDDGSGTVGATYQMTARGSSVDLTSDGAGWLALGRLTGAASIDDGTISINKLDTSVTGRLAKVGDLKDKPYGATPDPGWARCDGAAISRSAYADLFAKIGTIYGDGDGSTTFNLPDYRGAFRRMWDNGASIDPDAASRLTSTVPGASAGAGAVTGDNVGTRQASATQQHTHGLGTLAATSSSITPTVGGQQIISAFNGSVATAIGVSGSGASFYSTTQQGAAEPKTPTITLSGALANAGASTGETRPYNVAVDVHILISEDEAVGASAAFATLLHGSGAPNDSLGNNNDYYIDEDSKEIYLKEAGTWVGSAKPIVGHTGINCTASSTTTPGSITFGQVRANNADWTLATRLYIADADKYNTDRSDFLAAIANNGRIVIRKSGNPNQAIWYNVTAAPSDQTTYWEFTVVYVDGDYAPSNTDAIIVLDQLPGTPGAAGSVSAAGDGTAGAPAFSYASDTDTGWHRTGSGTTAYSADGTDTSTYDANGIAIGSGGLRAHKDGYVELPEIAAPGTPASGIIRAYAKTDGKLYIKDDAGTETDLTATGGGGGGTVDPAAFSGRLTLTSGTPITTSDVTAATNIYLTPFGGNLVALYSGSAWAYHTLTERTLSLSGLTANTVYDIFLYDNSGTLTLEAVAWSSTTARATAIVLQDGVYVKSGATTRRHVGIFKTTATTGQTEDSNEKRFLWNRNNRIARPLRKLGTGSHVATGGGGWGAWLNAASTYLVEWVSDDLDPVFVDFSSLHFVASGGTAYVGLDLDGATTGADAGRIVGTNSTSAVLTAASATINRHVGIGSHYVTAMQKPGASNTTFYGSVGDAVYGMIGHVMG